MGFAELHTLSVLKSSWLAYTIHSLWVLIRASPPFVAVPMGCGKISNYLNAQFLFEAKKISFSVAITLMFLVLAFNNIGIEDTHLKELDKHSHVPPHLLFRLVHKSHLIMQVHSPGSCCNTTTTTTTTTTLIYLYQQETKK